MLTLDERFTFQGESVAWGSIGDGAPVILIHGFPWSAQAWRNTSRWFSSFSGQLPVACCDRISRAAASDRSRSI